jgi:hypothetical protein
LIHPISPTPSPWPTIFASKSAWLPANNNKSTRSALPPPLQRIDDNHHGRLMTNITDRQRRAAIRL